MNSDELATLLQSAFEQCERANLALSIAQQQILRQTLQVEATNPAASFAIANPLDQLTSEERAALLEFIRQQESQNLPWKMTLLNDWLQGRASGSIQFLRDRYGVQWLEQVQTVHLAQYNDLDQGEVLRLKVGDRIEVSNGLWEWVQETGPCRREWVSCTVVQLQAPIESSETPPTSCTVRFENGSEYEIQGVYDWNRPNWRWIQS
jgi:16S rRNA U1498 N3-methylase RsmE